MSIESVRSTVEIKNPHKEQLAMTIFCLQDVYAWWMLPVPVDCFPQIRNNRTAASGRARNWRRYNYWPVSSKQYRNWLLDYLHNYYFLPPNFKHFTFKNSLLARSRDYFKVVYNYCFYFLYEFSFWFWYILFLGGKREFHRNVENRKYSQRLLHA